MSKRPIKSRIILPPIAFGAIRSDLDLDLEDMQARIGLSTNWVTEYDATCLDQVSFEHRSSIYASKKMRLLAVSSTPTVMKVNDPDCTLAIPFYGDLFAYTGGQKIHAQANGQAIYFAPGARHAEGGIKSTVLLSVKQEALIDTAKIMFGSKHGAMNLDQTRVIDLRVNHFDFYRFILQQCSTIDQFSADPTVLGYLGFEENLLRSLVMLLSPEGWCRNHDTGLLVKGQGDMRQLLERFVQENMDKPITLGMMQQVSEMSARSLQSVFKTRYGLTPTQWVRLQKLEYARQQLMNPSSHTNVTRVALSCGFANASEFAKYYARQYAELPSDTLKKYASNI